MRLKHDVAWLWEEQADSRNVCRNKKKYCSCRIILIRIDTILSKNIYNNFQNLLFRKLHAQSGDLVDIFWKFYSPTDILLLPKTVGRVLVYTIACLPKFLCEVLSWCQAQLYSQEFPSSVLARWRINAFSRLCSAKPANKGKLVQFNMQKYNQLVPCSLFI